MKLAQLEQVIRITAEGSINKAAASLYITQSNLSQSVRNLEKELGRPIFLRTGSGVELTKFGSDFLVYARDIVGRCRRLESFCREELEPVTVFSVSSWHIDFITRYFAETCLRHAAEHTKFSLFDGTLIEILDQVRYQQSELGFIFLPQEERKQFELRMKGMGLLFESLVISPLRICVGSKNPLFHSAEEAVTLSRLRDFPLILYEDTLSSFYDLLHDAGIDDHPRIITVSDQYAMNYLMLNTEGFSLTTDTGVYGVTGGEREVREFRPEGIDIQISLGFVRNSSRPLSPAAEEFLSGIRKQLKKKSTYIH